MNETRWLDLVPAQDRELAGRLMARAEAEVRAGAELYPPNEKILRALEMTPPALTKAVIVGQDPYHTPGQADGLAFSVSSGNGLQPSLQNIYKELHDDLGVPVPSHGDLTPWARQGVLLLNTSLTVYRGRPDSCRDWGWEAVTSAVLTAALSRCPQPVMFVCWGSKAIKFFQEALDQMNRELATLPDGPEKTAMRACAASKYVIKSTHPSPFSATKPSSNAVAFLGSRPFSAVNRFLVERNVAPIDWAL